MQHRRQAGLTVLVAVLLAVLSACGSGGQTTPPDHAPTSSQPVSLHGPIASTPPFVFGQNRPPNGQLQDAYATQLINTANQVVILDKVTLANEKHASPLRFAGAFVAPAGSNLQVVSAKQSSHVLARLAGYRLRPTHHMAHVLVLRVGPASAGQTEGFRFSRNNNVNLFYHTPDGKRYDVVYPVQIEYPNA